MRGFAGDCATRIEVEAPESFPSRKTGELAVGGPKRPENRVSFDVDAPLRFVSHALVVAANRLWLLSIAK